MKVWRWVAVAAAVVCFSGCTDRYEVLSQTDLDQAPAIIQMDENTAGFKDTDFLLALVPAPAGKVRVNRDFATIVAVAAEGADRWVPLTPEQTAKPRTARYFFVSPAALRTKLPKLVTEKLGKKWPLTDPNDKAVWARMGVTNSAIDLEVGFDTLPMTVRKNTYRPTIDGFSFDIDKAATLKVRQK